MPRADAVGETRTANATRVSRPASPGLEPERAREVESGSEPEVEAASDSELKPGWLGETGRWLLVVLAYSAAGCGLWAAMFELYFHGFHEVQQTRRCDAQLDGGWTALGQDVEDFVGAVPIWLRGFIMGALGVTVCRRVSGFVSDEPHVAQALLIGRGSTVGKAKEAGWDAIVGSRNSKASEALQSDWDQARESRRLTVRQAISSAVTKLLFWHASQPIVYLYMLGVYSCHVSSLGGWQRELAATVAVREVLYLASILLALWDCPVFLLMDPVTAWNEADTRVEKVIRVAMYVLTPHNYVAFCLANRFRGWRRTFLGLAAIQVIADLASCFALGTLIAGGISSQKNTPTALIIGYTITGFGFLLFFGPLSVCTSMRAAADTAKSRLARIAFGILGSALLCLLCYIMLLYILLMSGKVNPYCDGITFQPDPCNGHGACYAAGQCHCDLGWGPEVTYTGEAMCAKPDMPCTADQLTRALNHPDGDVCCARHGKPIPGGCECDELFWPGLTGSVLVQDALRPTHRLCQNYGCPDRLIREDPVNGVLPNGYPDLDGDIAMCTEAATATGAFKSFGNVTGHCKWCGSQYYSGTQYAVGMSCFNASGGFSCCNDGKVCRPDESCCRGSTFTYGAKCYSALRNESCCTTIGYPQICPAGTKACGGARLSSSVCNCCEAFCVITNSGNGRCGEEHCCNNDCHEGTPCGTCSGTCESRATGSTCHGECSCANGWSGPNCTVPP